MLASLSWAESKFVTLLVGMPNALITITQYMNKALNIIGLIIAITKFCNLISAEIKCYAQVVINKGGSGCFLGEGVPLRNGVTDCMVTLTNFNTEYQLN